MKKKKMNKNEELKTITKEQLKLLNHHKQVMFALFCAKQVVHVADSEDALKCIEVVEKWLDGKASDEECRIAGTTANAAGNACYATGNAADYAGYAADYGADYAANAAGNAYYAARAGYYANDAKDEEKLILEQNDYYDSLLNIDKYAEELIL